MQERPMLVEKEIRIGGYDIDAMGIVSNIVYVRWFEDLRMAILDKYYPYTQMLALNVSPILLKTEIEYKAALTIYNRPTGRCWMNRMSKSRWEMGLEIVSGQKIHCTGTQSGCFYHLERRRATQVPERLLVQYQAEADGQAL